MPELRVLLAEDAHMVRGALVALLKLEPDLRVVASVDRGDAIVPTAVATQPDVAVIDVVMPGLDGLTAAEELRQHLPNCGTLILTAVERPGTLRRALDMKVGGLLFKNAPPEQLSKAIRSVATGQRFIDPQVVLSAWDYLENPLSPRELDVLQMVAEGADPVEIAKSLHLSKGTVRNYLTTIVTKLNARSRVDAVLIAREAGWLA
ncbi:DNA-binding response regulator [Streptomyces armeniacus]|uniref:DNA-binding response regulator n=1 Tax=Streptomyces armeniacus TaxID=83291 RepID=A0A345XUY6_9ACTN|nr:response regulator transcription factor [Streptomyces armeniacus]AWS21297.1 DNA-binding response regulator [Streptomyces armeniacus]AXK35452.1 DNA-binding response regulator [Streptomyces armeniacus]AZY92019.1 putative two-component system response regulator [Streptomyces armeniacus]